jgi:riboflavin kinase / FMN adenylyltransferase
MCFNTHMLVYQNPLDRPHTPCILAIGSFDGLHLGHQALLAKQKSLALEYHVPSVVYTFDQPTRVLLEGSKYLYTLAEKLKILEHYGVDEVVTVPFTLEFSQRSVAEFVEDLRVLLPKAIVVGDDFRFGQGRSGGLEDLRGITSELIALEQQSLKNQIIKASKIRGLLELGDVKSATDFLGRPFSARGVVVHGKQLGRTIGFPTANIAVSNGKILPPGVFAVHLETPDGISHPGMANVGTRPTVGGMTESLEVFVFDFEGDLYGLEVRVDFLERLRSEQKFDGLEALKAQLERDKTAARAFLSRH